MGRACLIGIVASSFEPGLRVLMPVGRLVLTADAFQWDAKECRATRLREYPGRQPPGRVVPDVLTVATGAVGHPVPLVVLMEAHDGLLHRCVVAREFRGRGGDAG